MSPNTGIGKCGKYTVSAPLKPWGSIFQNEFLGGFLLIFDLPGVVIEMGIYWLDQNIFDQINHSRYLHGRQYRLDLLYWHLCRYSSNFVLLYLISQVDTLYSYLQHTYLPNLSNFGLVKFSLFIFKSLCFTYGWG